MQVLCPSLGGREPDYHKRKLHTEVDNAISLKLKIINSIFTSPGDWEPDYDKQCTKKKKNSKLHMFLNSLLPVHLIDTGDFQIL